MRDDSPQWFDVGQPATPAEAAALRAVKAMLPDGAIAWAWSNLSFISVNGRLAETDVLLLTRTGLTLIELKGRQLLLGDGVGRSERCTERSTILQFLSMRAFPSTR